MYRLKYLTNQRILLNKMPLTEGAALFMPTQVIESIGFNILTFALRVIKTPVLQDVTRAHRQTRLVEALLVFIKSPQLVEALLLRSLMYVPPTRKNGRLPSHNLVVHNFSTSSPNTKLTLNILPTNSSQTLLNALSCTLAPKTINHTSSDLNALRGHYNA